MAANRAVTTSSLSTPRPVAPAPAPVPPRGRARRRPGTAPRRFAVATDAHLGLIVRDAESVDAQVGVPLVEQGPMQQIALVREGVPAALVADLAESLGLTKEKLYAGTGLKRATIDAKVRAGVHLAPDESERVLGLARLLGRVQAMWRESGDHEAAPDFAPAAWLGRWLDDPNPALGGERPLALLDTATGRDVVDRLLLAMQAGAYW